jgi:AcrR family transcriptional regulator
MARVTRYRKSRRAGRPKGSKFVVSRESVLTAALELLELGGLSAFTMRALARRLRVDPMAPYHYFPDKHAILRAAAAQAYSSIEFEIPASADPRRRLVGLGTSYLAFLSRSGELLRYLTARDEAAAAPARDFDVQFRTAVAALPFAKSDYETARDAFVDFVHGFSLAVRGEPSPALRRKFERELTVIIAGIEASGRTHRRPYSPIRKKGRRRRASGR